MREGACSAAVPGGLSPHWDASRHADKPAQRPALQAPALPGKHYSQVLDDITLPIALRSLIRYTGAQQLHQ